MASRVEGALRYRGVAAGIALLGTLSQGVASAETSSESTNRRAGITQTEAKRGNGVDEKIDAYVKGMASDILERYRYDNSAEKKYKDDRGIHVVYTALSNVPSVKSGEYELTASFKDPKGEPDLNNLKGIHIHKDAVFSTNPDKRQKIYDFKVGKEDLDKNGKEGLRISENYNDLSGLKYALDYTTEPGIAGTVPLPDHMLATFTHGANDMFKQAVNRRPLESFKK